MEGEDLRALAAPSGARPLILDHVDPDPAVARRLSPAVASRHHVVPVAAKDRQVTVAMADPTDTVALEAVANELGVAPYVLQGDRTSIDRLLAKLWCDERQDASHLLAYTPSDSTPEEITSYATYVGDLLDEDMERVPREAVRDILAEKTTGDYELVIMGKPDEPFWRRVFSGPAGGAALHQLPVSLLIAHRPLKPLRRLLLVIHGDPSDSEATEWTLRLAGPSGASVTTLAVVPPVSTMDQGLARMERGLAELLTTDTMLGRQMRRVARQLVDRHIEGTLRLRQGSPEREIRRELAEGQFDLLVIAAASQGPGQWWTPGDLIISLVRAVKRPMLIAQ
ncbi:MAG: universal stress protein [Chloroflexota bacterium]|nr:universal stress protein [Chloroflexota bacterium]